MSYFITLNTIIASKLHDKIRLAFDRVKQFNSNVSDPQSRELTASLCFEMLDIMIDRIIVLQTYNIIYLILGIECI